MATKQASMTGTKTAFALPGRQDPLPLVDITLQDVTIRAARGQRDDHAQPSCSRALKAAMMCSDTRSLPGKGNSGFDATALLHRVSARFRPGTATLIMAPPGGGVSLLMKAIAGLPTSGTKLTGSVCYAGARTSTSDSRSLARYVSQHDAHLPLLTVRETLQFACEASLAPIPGSSHADTCSERVDTVLSELGLTSCADTLVGDGRVVRGVSGGEQRRLSIGEAAVAAPRVILVDQATTGLDSTTALKVCSLLTRVAHEQKATVVVSLLQPSLDLFNLFDNVLLLCEGRIVYTGPTFNLKAYLASIGFVPPTDMSFPAFVSSILADPQRAVQHSLRTSGPGKAPVPSYSAGVIPPRTTSSLVRCFEAFLSRQYTAHRQLLSGAASPTVPLHVVSAAPFQAEPAPGMRSQQPMLRLCTGIDTEEDILPHVLGGCPGLQASSGESKEAAQALARGKSDPQPATHAVKQQYCSGPARSLTALVKLNIWRQAKVTYRDKAFLQAHIGNAITMGLVFGSVFWGLDLQDMQLKMGLLFFCSLFLSFASMAEVPLSIAGKRVVGKQVNAGLYKPGPFAICVAAVHLPIALVETLSFGSLVYWMAGFANDPVRFGTFICLLLCINVSMAAYFRVVSYASPSLELAQVASGPSVAVAFLFGGFLLTRHRVPSLFQPLYWVSPFAWVVRSLAGNEFLDGSYDLQVPLLGYGASANHTQRLGDLYLDAFEIQKEPHWIWLGATVLVSYMAVLVVAAACVLHWCRSEDRSGTRRRSQSPSPDAPAKQGLQGKMPVTGGTLVSAPTEQPRVRDSYGSTDSGTERGAGVVVSWTGVGVEVAAVAGAPKRILTDACGCAYPGTLTALMGPSGAGKTTLLDVLSGRIRSGKGMTVTGRVLFNGKAADSATFRAAGSYVEQRDLHMPHCTVRETLEFAATTQLQLPANHTPARSDVPSPSSSTSGSASGQLERRYSVDDAELGHVRGSGSTRYPGATTRQTIAQRLVEETLDVLELRGVQSRLVGAAGRAGLSAGELKRLSIGVELVTNPMVLFVDEPTSCLDRKAADKVMQVLRRVANTGRTVVCTIHQPSADTFFTFDRLVLLASGGKLAYSGPLGCRAEFVIKVLSTPSSVRSLQSGENPADWILDQVSATATPTTVEGASTHQLSRPEAVAAAFAQSTFASTLTAECVDSQRRAGLTERVEEMLNPVPHRVKWAAVLVRAARSQWRNTSYNRVRGGVMLTLGVLFGALFSDVDATDMAGVQSLLSVIFMTLLFATVVNMIAVIGVVAAERSVFEKERGIGAYPAAAYAMALALVELPYVLLGAVLFVAPLYAIIGLQPSWDIIANYVLAQALAVMVFVAMGQLLAIALPSAEVAILAGNAVVSLWTLFGGFYVPLPDLPVAWKWMYYTNPLPLAYEAMLMPQFQCSQVDCPRIETVTLDGVVSTQTSAFVENVTGFAASNSWINLAWLGLFVVLTQLSLAVLVTVRKGRTAA